MQVTWRKPARSEGANNCVEVGSTGLIRDSKNPSGPVLSVKIGSLIAAIKDGRVTGSNGTETA